MAEGLATQYAPQESPDIDSCPTLNPDFLRTKRVLLVERLEEFESLLAGLKPFFQYPELDEINAQPNRGDRVRKLIDYLERRIASQSFDAFNVFMKIVAGVQPELFITLADRIPTEAEADFCVQNFVQATKKEIHDSGHVTDSALDQEIDLDNEHIELAIVRDTEVSDALPHQHKSHLSNMATEHDTIPVLQILDGEGDEKPKKVSLHGRAGTGKTTTMQWLARQWSLNRWTARFTMIFLIQLRMLSLSDFPITATELLTAYSLYRVAEEDLVALASSWIKSHTSNFLLFIDGLDEIGGFRSRLKNCKKITDVNVKAHPVDICLNIIQGNLLPGCTVVCASRPFTGLSAINFDRRLEILGLDESCVENFVKQRHPSRSDHILSVLKESPLLMSVCSITFYCTLISQLLADGVIFRNEDLQTYTRLIAFLMVQCVSRRLSEFPFMIEVHGYFPKLASMAYRGMIEGHQSEQISKLVFDARDIVKAQLMPQDLKALQRFGVLQMKSVKNPLRSSVIAEFLHLSMQELLASAYLLAYQPQSEDILKNLFSGGQFNMALLYLFGLQYDTQSTWVTDIRCAVDPSNQGTDMRSAFKVSDFFRDLCNECTPTSESSHKLQICQLVHESQLEDLANTAVESITSHGELALANTPLTMIDLMALRFVCKYTNISTISVESSMLTDILVRFLVSSVLKDHDKTLKALQLGGNKIGDDGAQAIGEWLEENKTLQTLEVQDNKLGGSGAIALAKALQDKNRLTCLNISNNCIGKNGAKMLSQALHLNKSLRIINIHSCNIGDNGACALAQALTQNNTLQDLDVRYNNIGDKSAMAFAHALEQNNTLVKLDVGNNNIAEYGGKALAKVLPHNKTLQILNVGANKISDKGAKAFAESFSKGIALKKLDVGNNNISMGVMDTLQQEMQKCEKVAKYGTDCSSPPMLLKPHKPEELVKVDKWLNQIPDQQEELVEVDKASQWAPISSAAVSYERAERDHTEIQSAYPGTLSRYPEVEPGTERKSTAQGFPNRYQAVETDIPKAGPKAYGIMDTKKKSASSVRSRKYQTAEPETKRKSNFRHASLQTLEHDDERGYGTHKMKNSQSLSSFPFEVANKPDKLN